MKKIYALVSNEREKECVDHLWRYSGTIPCTGLVKCTVCGTTKEEN